MIPALLFLVGGIGWDKHTSDIWVLVPLCLMCRTWRKSNRRTFKDVDGSDNQLLASFSGFLFD